MDGVGAGVDELAELFGEVVEVVGVEGADEDAALDAVAPGLEGGSGAGAGAVRGDVVGDEDGRLFVYRQDRPVNGVPCSM